MYVHQDNSDFWMDEIEWSRQVWYVEKQIDSKDFKMLDGHQNAF